MIEAGSWCWLKVVERQLDDQSEKLVLVEVGRSMSRFLIDRGCRYSC